MGWIDLALDRDKLRSVGNKAMNNRVHKMGAIS